MEDEVIPHCLVFVGVNVANIITHPKCSFELTLLYKISSKEGWMWGGKGGIKIVLRVGMGETCSYM